MRALLVQRHAKDEVGLVLLRHINGLAVLVIQLEIVLLAATRAPVPPRSLLRHSKQQ